MTRARMLVAAVATGALLSACGSDEAADPAGVETPAGTKASAAMVHVHGVDADRQTGDVLVATHDGLFRIPAGGEEPERVSESTPDLMGFSVAGDERLIASGHPAPDQALPPHLGLVESIDGGRTWDSVSLLGEADFHVLETAGRRVYGVDGLQGRLMASTDGGRTWREQPAPDELISLAIDPGDPAALVASTARGLIRSGDAGRTWSEPADAPAGLLAWPAEDSLHLVDGEGRVLRSADAGRSFRPVGDADGQPVAFSAGTDGALLVALADGRIARSDDGGASWVTLAS